MNIGIVGYGKLGQALERRCRDFPDISIKYVVSRRAGQIRPKLDIPVIAAEDALRGSIDVDCMIIAVGSERDATDTVLAFLERFNTVDCFDMHRYGTKHRKIAENGAKNSNRTALCMSGWDPGLLSVVRLYLSSFIPNAECRTFWGEGVSQGHTNALKSIGGVIDAVQYTVPLPEAKASALRGDKYCGASHKRVCLVSCTGGEEGRIERKIRESEYFKGCDTDIRFVSKDELSLHNKLYHKGEVIAADKTMNEAGSRAVFTLEMDSNPDFTAGILLASSRAVCRLYNEGKYGAFTLFDIPPSYFYPSDPYFML